jgi:hypothetical protein
LNLDELIQSIVGGGSYKKYVALLSPPIGDDAPVATILENTLGSDIVWEKSSVGIYSGANENFVDATKVFMSFTPNVSGEGNGNVTIVGGEIYNSDGENKLWFSTTMFQTGLLGDTWGTYLPIEIRVYN